VNDELMVVRLGLGARTVEYNDGWELQRQIHERRVAGDAGDCCLLLEHDPVYTAGKRTRPEDRPAPGIAAAPVVDVDRGGRITWHGPGQLVGYPIIALNEPVDVIAYVRALEEAMIRTCADFGVTATRVEGRSGAWVTGGGRPDRKVGAIGIRVSRGVTMHGIALNCDNDLSWYGTFVPCGISDAGVTSLTAEAGRPVGVLAAADSFAGHLAAALGYRRWRAAAAEELTGSAQPA
jgi:lipoyl(octanoyl) transferase